ncbi:hypothetical protein V6N11_011612 [Hibiscus sabdariffa]|uniref:SBP-type domain-containing protein n=1 Tax=Hibiscus sabdariffa TaxID=183260 RepID=A0ABR2S8S7_9ROSI
MESSAAAASFKRARASGSGSQVPSCLVDGCTADLSKCRDYHRRHKVCEVHSKTPKVTIRGLEQRFCQQCSRFHSLVEFDEVKRSCRKRLDGHNRRRRKPQPDSLSANSGSGRASLFPGFSSDNYKGEKQFSFLQTTSSSLPGSVSVCQPFLDSIPSSSNSSSSWKMFPNSLNQTIDSNRALSLLSSQPAATREIGLSPMVQHGSASSLMPNLHYNDLGGIGGEQVGTAVLAADGGGNTNLHGHEMFQNEHPASSATGAHHTLSFSWE